MQIGSSFSPMTSGQVALRLLNSQAAPPAAAPKLQETGISSGDIKSLLAYAKEAGRIASQRSPAEPTYDPAKDLPEDWVMGELVSVDTLDPAYRDFARSNGATHVRLYGPAPLSDEAFSQKVSAFLDESYGNDPAYLAARTAGQIDIRREADVMAQVGETRFGSQHMAFYRGQGGSEYFGSGSTGIPSERFDRWAAAQSAGGRTLAIGGTMGLSFVASWPSS